MDDPRLGPAGDAGGSASEDAASGLVGTVLAGRYRIVRKLGEGAMGAVYLGEHLKIGRMDAIKVLRAAMSADPEAAARFLRGARNVSAIRHPNVCTIYDFSDTADGLQFLAMEYVAGETLKELLEREGVLLLERAVEVARQTASALQAAHDAGIVHRDLKPANIMVARGRGGADVVKVVDFDIAKGSREGAGAEVTRLGFVVGTPEYMSPEQLMGEALDGRSDVYSLALVLFRMLTGALPFRAEAKQDLAILRLTERPLRLDEVLPGAAFPEALQRALDRALERRPSDRQPDAETFGREIAAAIASAAAPETLAPTRVAAQPGIAAPAAAGTPAGSTGSRMRWITAAAVVVGLGIAAFTARALLTGVPAAGIPEGAALETPAGSGVVVADAADGTRERVPDRVEGGGAAEPSAAAPERHADGGERTAGPAEPNPGVAGTPPAPGITLAAADANDVLWRQFERVGPPSPPRAALEAIRDTAGAIWRLEGVSTRDRAFAAYILGTVLPPLGDTVQGRRWAERAVQLCPDCPGYGSLLDSYRKQPH
ncbi:MAG TPA: serine/threonine-protein kinase [Longimicrobiales bacterium]